MPFSYLSVLLVFGSGPRLIEDDLILITSQRPYWRVSSHSQVSRVRTTAHLLGEHSSTHNSGLSPKSNRIEVLAAVLPKFSLPTVQMGSFTRGAVATSLKKENYHYHYEIEQPLEI